MGARAGPSEPVDSEPAHPGEAGPAHEGTTEAVAEAGADEGTPLAGPDAVEVEQATDGRDEELARLREQLARARADYSNLEKRVERDAQLERERVRARVLEGFLGVFEYGRLAAQEAERNPGPLADGIRMVVDEFHRLLEREGVQPIGTPGELFDRSVHEAVAEEAAPGAAPGEVVRVVAPGYRLGSRVLRFAKVVVAPA